MRQQIFIKFISQNLRIGDELNGIVAASIWFSALVVTVPCRRHRCRKSIFTSTTFEIWNPIKVSIWRKFPLLIPSLQRKQLLFYVSLNLASIYRQQSIMIIVECRASDRTSFDWKQKSYPSWCHATHSPLTWFKRICCSNLSDMWMILMI